MADRRYYEVFELGDLALRRGATLRDAKLAYEVYGEQHLFDPLAQRQPVAPGVVRRELLATLVQAVGHEVRQHVDDLWMTVQDGPVLLDADLIDGGDVERAHGGAPAGTGQ